MNKMILVVSPEEACRILNGEQSILVRKVKPRKLPCECNIYVAKGKKILFKDLYAEKNGSGKLYYIDSKKHDSWSQELNCKVVARFWCDKVELIEHSYSHFYFSEEESKKMLYEGLIERLGCINADNLHLYLKGKKGYAIHITKVEPFDKPKEINEFVICREKKHECRQKFKDYPCRKCVSMNLLTRAPRSGWCYVEV